MAQTSLSEFPLCLIYNLQARFFHIHLVLGSSINFYGITSNSKGKKNTSSLHSLSIRAESELKCAPAHALQGNIFQFHLTQQGRYEIPSVVQGVACFTKSTFLFAMNSGNITYRTVHSTYQSKGIQPYLHYIHSTQENQCFPAEVCSLSIHHPSKAVQELIPLSDLRKAASSSDSL